MSSKLYRGSDILKQAKQSKTVTLTRTQTAKHAKSAISMKYKDIVASAQYYHRGGGTWIKYSPIADNKRTSKKVKSKIPKNFESIRHKIDVRGVDTKPIQKVMVAKKVAKVKPASLKYQLAKRKHGMLDAVAKYDLLERLPSKFEGTTTEASIRYLMEHPRYKPPSELIDSTTIKISKDRWQRLTPTQKKVKNGKRYMVIQEKGIGTILTPVVVK